MAIRGIDRHDKRAELAARLRQLRRLLRRRAAELRCEQEARAAAENANQGKDRILAAVCHDLRTPLNAMMLWTQLARSTSAAGPQLDEALSRIEINGRLQSALIGDILDLAKNAEGTLRIDRQRVDLNSVVAEALAIVEPAAAGKRVEIKCSASAAPAFVMGDPIRLERVVWNLLTNAVKFSPSAGRVSIEVQAEGATVRLRVSDTGCGISPAFLPHVFERFKQEGPEGAHRPGGAGLGLAIVRRLVELHGGCVEANSAGEGCGASFTVTLPRVRGIADPTGEPNDACISPRSAI